MPIVDSGVNNANDNILFASGGIPMPDPRQYLGPIDFEDLKVPRTLDR